MMPPECDWTPSSELLAAYADGEFEGRDDLTSLRQRLEDWLLVHPEAQVELGEYRRLRQAWLDTTPAEPSPAAWEGVLEGIRAGQANPAPGRAGWSWWPVLSASVLAASVACLVLVAAFGSARVDAPIAPPLFVEEDAVFPVATANEVVILRVEGGDENTLVVGELPLQGPLELVGPGDVTLTSVQPDARDNMVPHFVSGPGRPMFWARLETD
jgi:hypothetical protein